MEVNKDLKKIFYVYAYLDPRKSGKYRYGECCFTNVPFYIGKGHGRRKLRHLSDAKHGKRDHKHNIIKQILREGLEPIIIEVKSNLTEKESFDLEQYLISNIGRYDLKTGPLANLTDGGDGTVNVCREAVERVRATKIGKKRPRWIVERQRKALLGRKLPESQKKKMVEKLILNQKNGGYTKGFKHDKKAIRSMNKGLINSFLRKVIDFYGIDNITFDNYEELSYKFSKRIVRLSRIAKYANMNREDLKGIFNKVLQHSITNKDILD